MWNFPCGSLLRSELAHPHLPALFPSCVTLTGRLLPSCHRLALGACLGARGCLVVCVLCGRGGGGCPWVAWGKGISLRQVLCGTESREVQMGFHQALACFRRLGGVRPSSCHRPLCAGARAGCVCPRQRRRGGGRVCPAHVLVAAAHGAVLAAEKAL